MLTLVMIIQAVYLLLIVVIYYGWKKLLSAKQTVSNTSGEFISVIVPVRNEERNMKSLIGDLLAQDYRNFEIIVVDDHSEDNTEKIIHAVEHPMIKCVLNEGNGKKSAITTGISIAGGSIIVTTDADCHLPSSWLTHIDTYFADDSCNMVIGPVALKDNGSLFSRMQQIEFSSLTGVAGATAWFNMPVMCNGANLAYRKSCFEKVDGYTDNMSVPSGDDEFLMRKIAAAFPGSIRFLAASGGIIRTFPMPTADTFIQQRVRWASKGRYNKSLNAVLLALFVVVAQVATAVCFFELLYDFSVWWCVLLIARGIADGILLRTFCEFLRIPWSNTAFVLLFLVYPFYVIYVAAVSNFTGFSWKGRDYR